MKPDELIISSITAPGRLPSEFAHLSELNVVEFSRQGNAVIYAPNGSGKSTIAHALCGTPGSSMHCEGVFSGSQFSSLNGSKEFYLIKDQDGRNVAELPGSRALLLGDDVARELELDDLLTDKFQAMKKALKSEFAKVGLTVKGNTLAAKLKEADPDLVEAIDLVFGNSTTREKLFDFMDQACSKWYVSNPFEGVGRIKGHSSRDCLADKDGGSAYKTIAAKNDSATPERVAEAGNLPLYEKEAELLLQFQPDMQDCPTCGAKWSGWSDAYRNLQQKIDNITGTLNDKQQKIIGALSQTNPNLFKAYTHFLENGDAAPLERELENIQNDIREAAQFAKFTLAKAIRESGCVVLWKEYKEIRNKVGFDNAWEDIELMREVASSYLGKTLDIQVTSGNNLKIELSSSELPSHPQEFPLSTGEKNFLSLLLDLTRAKRSNTSCIVIDDPVSSFDSIFKNRIAYLILDMLKDKKVIVLTHNLELVRLLHEQHQDCFNLYMLAASEGGLNGFEPVNRNEIGLLLYADKLPKLLPDHGSLGIKDNESFLISLIPYIRSWANLTGKSEAYERCCALMHCKHQDASPVEIAPLFNEVFKGDLIDDTAALPSDLAEKNLETLPETIVDENLYPLLNRTLIHNYAFYLLRLKVEHALLSYCPDASLPSKPKLYNYISACLRDSENEYEKRWRRKMLSKKTLLNSFSHYEWNVNVFQPAIDISEKTLTSEIQEVLAMVDEIININRI
ncbi:AAA family ATPase [Gordonibacter sp. RACS_AR49]|uniref:AAA family ATPase n=1 Tax=Gordonibacter sp. RACS_AR49 TaxID=2871986 RepID=UPI002602CB56|nr:AAA family ATPase [Gordonibacter sp. RACS_AR49]MDN4509355.1 AAA family ATPase [Gordonibacter sp. RACS_AR49]